MITPVRTFNVLPALPPPLERLGELAYNLRWTWDHATIELFRRLDADLWERAGHNPVALLGAIDQDKLAAAAEDEGFLTQLERVYADFADYMAAHGTWFERASRAPERPLIAYFSAEFGLTECLSIFAGGLGLLAGDHLKSASDLGLPLVGVGLLYQQGYFRQYLNDAGWQQEAYEDNDFHNLPLTLERGPDGGPLAVAIPHPGREVAAHVWRAQVGRVALYLLDTNLPSNPPDDRDLTDQLYGGDLELRIRQEIVLGVGGYRALRALGLRPTVLHMNEGHSAFLALEHIRQLMVDDNLSFAEASALASAGLVFTTHTPVAAGQDFFPPELVDRYFTEYARGLGISRDQFLGLGRINPAAGAEPFCMTVLALRLAEHSNGVSRLHRRVTRRMWQPLWAGVPEAEVPVGHITNGVHLNSWLSQEMAQLYDRYLGLRWREDPADPETWQRARNIPPEELWRTHERRRERLVAFVRRRLRGQEERRGVHWAEVEGTREVLIPDALTIGFGRRFATYKRATLLLRDPDRLARLLTSPERPVQVIFAGKAHPRDDAGKELIREIVALSRREPFQRRLVFLEDYDLAVARALVQGCDVWLNTPQRPLEASGTSGMKAAANGVLNLSTLDGWWDEAWWGMDLDAAPLGWAIGRGEDYEDPEYQDQVEAEALYELLEQEIVPTFYARAADGLPRRWIDRMKSSIGQLCPVYNTQRMVKQYAEGAYRPAFARYQRLAADGQARARALAAWRQRVEKRWGQVRLEAIDCGLPPAIRVGEEICAQARVHLDGLGPEDIAVQLYLGRLDAQGSFLDPEATPLSLVGPDGAAAFHFESGRTICRRSGLHGYTLRVLPHHPDLATPFVPGLITWASE
jgi:starch phosphorylase